MKEKESSWGGILIWALIVMVMGAICSGWAIRLLWGWFIVPVFGLPTLTIVQAIGIGMVVGLLTSQSRQQKDDRDTGERMMAITGYAIGYPVMIVGLAWIVTLFL